MEKFRTESKTDLYWRQTRTKPIDGQTGTPVPGLRPLRHSSLFCLEPPPSPLQPTDPTDSRRCPVRSHRHRSADRSGSHRCPVRRHRSADRSDSHRCPVRTHHRRSADRSDSHRCPVRSHRHRSADRSDSHRCPVRTHHRRSADRSDSHRRITTVEGGTNHPTPTISCTINNADISEEW